LLVLQLHIDLLSLKTAVKVPIVRTHFSLACTDQDLKLLYFDSNAEPDPDPAFHSNADTDSDPEKPHIFFLHP
jgi:hypothetical protein